MRMARLALLPLVLAGAACGRYNPAAPVAEAQAASRPAAMTASAPKATASTTTQAQPMQRRTVYFSGRVQGVGFRATAVDLSRGLDLAGEVRNLPDGRVELIVEGSPANMDKLVARLREHFGDFIRKVEQTTSPPQGLSRGVRITY